MDNEKVRRALALNAKEQRHTHLQIDVTQCWNEVWITQFTWTIGEIINGVVVALRCTCCTCINGHPKLNVPKFNNLTEYKGKRMATCDMSERQLKASDVYIETRIKHVRNTALYYSWLPQSML